MNSLLVRIRALATAAYSLEEMEKAVVEVIAAELPLYNWTGFYWLDPHDPQTLVLGAFIGEPTPHVRIPVTQGICGAAVASGETVVVGEIDIDSHAAAAFAEIDRAFLQEVARIVGAFVEDRCSERIQLL
jgi:GAF domain-containing protein